METPDSFSQLLDYPKEKKLNYETHLNDQRFYLSPNDPILNTKYIVFKKQGLIFCAYDSYSTQLSSTRTFTGIYSPIRLLPEMELKMTRKHWSDYVFSFHKRKTGIERIDKSFVVSTGNNWRYQILLTEKMAHLLQELEKQISPLKLVIQHDYIPMISELKGMHVIGIETNSWISEPEKVKCFLDLGGKIIEYVIKASKGIF